MIELKMNMIQTVGLAVIVLLVGRILRKQVKFFENYCIPSPVIGGFLFAIINLISYKAGFLSIKFDITLQSFFMTIFFTSVGFNASWKLLKIGGKKVATFLIASIGLVIAQNITAIGVGKLLGLNAILSLMTGSTPMTGGHGTSAAIAPLAENLGASGASTVAIAAATFGLIAGSSLGGPLANRLIKKHNIAIKPETTKEEKLKNDEFLFGINNKILDGEKFTKAFFIILVSMFIGSYVSIFLNKFLNFPSYIGPMLVAALLRNISDHTDKFNLHYEEIRILEDVSLNLFLGMAMMTLKLWELTGLALSLSLLLIAQVLLAYLYIYHITFRLMGKNYDAVVLSAGHMGFGLGATPNGIANMQSFSDKYAYSNVAFFVLPIVGALFIDFFNISIISLFLSWLQ
ncbi:sodium/glutamate symporter [Gemella sp. zg-570]|uniref:sodium/glutamate symporter n=1 Tax=Gemella sp. zg-570 TaxID=2840371 RepID=UPI001C0E03D8|nr:sodium/glutamate symporter [Gemella sp. zg-570]QWQ38694.1 sodium/glutamate symporter [Gemella sp. zg-570]